MLKGKNLLDYTNLFSPNKYEKKDKIITKNVFLWIDRKYGLKNISWEFRLKNTDETGHFVREIDQNDFFTTPNYIEDFLILASVDTECIYPVGIVKSAIALKICVITAEIKKFKSIIKKVQEAWSNSIVSKN